MSVCVCVFVCVEVVCMYALAMCVWDHATTQADRKVIYLKIEHHIPTIGGLLSVVYPSTDIDLH